MPTAPTGNIMEKRKKEAATDKTFDVANKYVDV